MIKSVMNLPRTFLKTFRHRPRLSSAIATGVLTYLFLPVSLIEQSTTKAILSWDLGLLIYLILAAHMMFISNRETMNQRAKTQDEGKFLILIFVALSVFFALGAIIAELSSSKKMHGSLQYLHIGLAVITILCNWMFMQVMFALHYAHDFYLAVALKKPPGLTFPGTDSPDYADFLYFSCVIGTSAQTADVSFSSQLMRRTGLAHCVLAFFFNTTLLALTINIGSGLF